MIKEKIDCTQLLVILRKREERDESDVSYIGTGKSAGHVKKDDREVGRIDSGIHLDERTDGLLDGVRVDLVHVQKLGGFRRARQLAHGEAAVVQRHGERAALAGREHCAEHRLAEAALLVVVLDSEQTALRARHRLRQRRAVHRLHREQVHQCHRHALFLQLLVRLERLRQSDARAHHCHHVGIRFLHHLADYKAHVWCVILFVESRSNYCNYESMEQ